MTRSGRSSRAAPSDSGRSSRKGDIERGTPCARRQQLVYTNVLALKNTKNVSDENDRVFVLLMTGQAHGEYRFRAVRPRFNVAAMGLGNLARDI
jgi:hypothetical protein